MRPLSLDGKRFGRLVVIARTLNSKRGRTQWICRCDCLREVVVSGDGLQNGTRSCGCLRHQPSHRFVDLIGKRFGSLVVGTRAANNTHGQAQWNCHCDCGQDTIVDGRNLRGGHTHSCGCLSSKVTTLRNIAGFKHGCSSGYAANAGAATPEYKAYGNAKNRCINPRCHAYPDYGGRGIEFRFSSYEEFLAHLGKRPSPEHSLDRYPDNDGHYEIGNVRWATRSEQQKNKRQYAQTKIITEAA